MNPLFYFVKNDTEKCYLYHPDYKLLLSAKL